MQVNKDSHVRFSTESESTYEIVSGKIRRLNPEYLKRGDGAWLKLLDMPYLKVGSSARLIVEPLDRLGTDDAGGVQGSSAKQTVRVTSPITRLEVL